MKYKWRVDGKQDWEENQHDVKEVFEGWEEELKKEGLGSGEDLVESVRNTWKGKGPSSNKREEGDGVEENFDKSKEWWLEEVEKAIHTSINACT